LKRDLNDGKVVVVDEFHRLLDDFFDFLHFTEKKGKLILISSTLFLSKKLISSKSALLGLFTEIPIGLISLEDSLKSLKRLNFTKKDKLELAILLKEPIAAEYIDEKKTARETISTILAGSVRTIPALIGEIFSEEAREISGVYEGVLRAIAIGKINSGEISSYLFSKKLIKKDDPSIIQQYLNNLLLFGIIKRIKLFNKKRFVYKLVSPLSRIYYYADEKYNISERRNSEEELKRIIDELMPRIVEDSVREHLAEKYGLIESIIEEKDYDIDACLLKFKSIELAVEIKWKKIDREDIRKSEETLLKIKSKGRIIFVPDKKGIKSNIELFDVDDL